MVLSESGICNSCLRNRALPARDVELMIMRHRFPKQLWILSLLVLVVLLAAHGFVFYRMASRLPWVVLVGVLLVALLTHSGILGSLYAVLMRRSRHKL